VVNTEEREKSQKRLIKGTTSNIRNIPPVVVVEGNNNGVAPQGIVESGVTVKVVWPPNVQSLVDWFLTLEPPPEPFYLEPHQHIMDPEEFFSALRMDIKAGPDGARGKHGALIYDLTALKKILH
jgi:hypothetical protein